MNEQGKQRAYNERILQTDHVHLELWCFQLTTVCEERAKNFTCVWHKWYLKRETFRSRFQLIGFEQMFASGC